MSQLDNYNEFLKSKIKVYDAKCFDIVEDLHPSLFGHQADIVHFNASKGCALIAASFGLGKTRINIQTLKLIKALHPHAPVLVVCPLGVRQEFTLNDGPAMGVQFQYVRNREEQHAATTDYHITNYERVRDGDMDLSMYIAVALDEGSVLRSLGTDTTQQFIHKFRATPYKFVYTATPSPNEYLELLNYAEFLGVMDRGQALTRFFKRNSQKAGELTIMPSMEKEFWLWVSSWAVFIEKPSDLGYSDEGYSLPPLNIHYHEVEVPADSFGVLKERDGQVKAFADAAQGLGDAAKIKRLSIPQRISKTIEIINMLPHFENHIIWHHLEDERKAIEQTFSDAVTVYGSQPLEEREQHIIDFSEGRTLLFATKPEIAGSGCNFQRHCNNAIFMGIDYKFNDFIQAVHRIYRFGQNKEVNIHIIYAKEEQPILDSLKNKWQLHEEQRAAMRKIVQEYGLNHADAIGQLSRSFGCERLEVKADNYTAIRNDSILEFADTERHPANYAGLIHTSIPFGNHYEYSASYNDLGHNDDNVKFWAQMDYLIPNLYRILKPGRIAAIHVKDRIQYATITGDGCYTILPFSDECVAAFLKHGFKYMSRIQIDTDVVRENNQTYRLGHTEKCKDASKMGAGLPEYLLIFRKPQTDLSRGYADEPVQKSKDDFTLGKWQLLASSAWRSDGNTLLSPQEYLEMAPDKVFKWWRMYASNEPYSWRYHVEIANTLAERNKLPKTHSQLATHSASPNRWSDINRMNCLNAEQMRRKVENHVCPLQFDIVERVIDNWSMEGDIVVDPFGGIGTVPLMAMKMKRKGLSCELNYDYWKQACIYLNEQEQKANIPTLFDALTA